jgi:hypothetical protein
MAETLFESDSELTQQDKLHASATTALNLLETGRRHNPIAGDVSQI